MEFHNYFRNEVELVLLAQAGLPLPALPALIVAGALVRDGRLSLTLVWLAAAAGSLLGDLPWYAAGRKAGYRAPTHAQRAYAPGLRVRQAAGDGRQAHWYLPADDIV